MAAAQDDAEPCVEAAMAVAQDDAPAQDDAEAAGAAAAAARAAMEPAPNTSTSLESESAVMSRCLRCSSSAASLAS